MPRQTVPPAPPGEITRLLAAARGGDDGAVHRLVALVYDDLRALARRQLRWRRPDQTLTTTALVHEAYLRLVDQRQASWQDRSHFFSVAALAMRQILVDAARRRAAGKRGGGRIRIALDELAERGEEPAATAAAVEVLALDDALSTLAAVDERLARLVELRFFGGLTEEETARLLGTSERTVRRDWRKARAFLLDSLDAASAE